MFASIRIAARHSQLLSSLVFLVVVVLLVHILVLVRLVLDLGGGGGLDPGVSVGGAVCGLLLWHFLLLLLWLRHLRFLGSWCLLRLGLLNPGDNGILTLFDRRLLLLALLDDGLGLLLLLLVPLVDLKATFVRVVACVLCGRGLCGLSLLLALRLLPLLLRALLVARLGVVLLFFPLATRAVRSLLVDAPRGEPFTLVARRLALCLLLLHLVARILLLD
mmetsp:Transcript_11227/g.25467  ORF Transcript_11227/g.25467 Transcript_11227/m.25467 type:complete len:219 (+) Transcript_11227:20-676(+)